MSTSDLEVNIINENMISMSLNASLKSNAGRHREVLDKARELKGLDAGDVAVLMQAETPEASAALFEAARWAKEEIYGRRMVLFAPLYASNVCHNECVYCGFRRGNSGLHRATLTQGQVAAETAALVDQGHKRVLFVAGEAEGPGTLAWVLRCIETIYSVKRGNGEIRRINANIAPLSVEGFRELKGAGIGTYQLFQETYHRPTYAEVHLEGRKRDFDWRVTAMDRAMEAGIDDVGVGVLFGLYDWRFEVLALMQHIAHLEERFGVGCHTISVPRLEPAPGSAYASAPRHGVSDLDFQRIVAILRLAVPYTGIIMSTRESTEMRRATLRLGVSQISAGSRTNPGGYGEEDSEGAQFSLGDHRGLDEVIADIAALGYIPSFCTGCYRLGRTGQDFMDLAKPGLIKSHCEVNAVSTFAEYLEDYASESTRDAGNLGIAQTLAAMDPAARPRAEAMLRRVRSGERDVYV